ncbi:MAG: ligase-associated DNA damage response exonuclease [Janthinobacterium lividum]
MELVVARKEGLYCPPGDFYIDPWQPVERAVITHAHGDHARSGHGHYLAAAAGAAVLRARLGDIKLQTLDYGAALTIGEVRVSLHPAGHVLGSAQVRIEHRGEVWVASGDYKLDTDPTCAPFESVRCDTFITESTFGLPIYRWARSEQTTEQMLQWWRANAADARASILFCYAFGKAQRSLAMLAAAAGSTRGLDSVGPVYCHGAVETLNRAYIEAGVALPATQRVDTSTAPRASRSSSRAFAGALILAPPSAAGSSWMKRFGDYSDGFASGWMRLRGARRRRGVDRGFVLSDHADWPSLQQAIGASGATRVIVTHGQVATLVRWLNEQGLDASAFSTEYGDDESDDPSGAAAEGVSDEASARASDDSSNDAADDAIISAPGADDELPA